MDEIFQKIIDNDFSDVAGLTVAATIPISQGLINEVLAVALEGHKTIHSAEMSVHEQNRISVRLKTNLLPLTLKLKLDASVDLASFSSPKLRAWMENNRMLGSLVSLFHALPEWARLYGNQVVIDLGFFLRSPEQKKILGLIKSVDIRTETGKAIFDIEIRIDPE